MRINYKGLFVLFTLLFGSVKGFSQEKDLLSIADEGVKPTKDFTMATFKGTRLINFHTCEVASKRGLDFRISHRFGDINSGTYNAWGLDGGANIRLGLEYSHDGRLQFGIGRTSTDKMADGFLKYKLLRQTTDNRNPVTITLLSCMYYTFLQDPNKASTGFDKYQYATSRMSYCHQIIIARKFTSRFSLQISPTLVHYNLVDKISDKNDVFACGFLTRFKLNKRIAVVAEYGLRLNKYTNDKYYDTFGAGFDIETGGHVFQLHLTNSFGIVENQFIAHTATSWKTWGVRLGFNISRIFTLGGGGGNG